MTPHKLVRFPFTIFLRSAKMRISAFFKSFAISFLSAFLSSLAVVSSWLSPDIESSSSYPRSSITLAKVGTRLLSFFIGSSNSVTATAMSCGFLNVVITCWCKLLMKLAKFSLPFLSALVLRVSMFSMVPANFVPRFLSFELLFELLLLLLV